MGDLKKGPAGKRGLTPSPSWGLTPFSDPKKLFFFGLATIFIKLRAWPFLGCESQRR